MKAHEKCKWAVAYKIGGENYDDRKERIGVTALFNYPDLAQDFINKCLPEETKEKFFVIYVDDLAD